MNSWNLLTECGGRDALIALLTDFYDRVFDDVIIGFLFAKSDKAALVLSQLNYVSANLGDKQGVYDGPAIRRAHVGLPILSGQFDRRHQILLDVLDAHDVPKHVATAWIALDLSLRPLVVNTGATARDKILNE